VDLIERGVPEGRVFTTVCDVTDINAIRRTVEETITRFGTVDVLINNAGIIQVGPMETMTQADYEEAFAVHFWGPYHFTEAVLPYMRTKKAGRIVHIASIGGLVRFPHMLPYTSSKSALVGYAEGLRAELLKQGIYVTLVCPGLIRTGSPSRAYFKGQNEKEYAWFKLGDSLPGVSQSAEDCAREIVGGLKHGAARVVTSLPAKAMTFAHGVAPDLVVDGLAIVGGLMPDANGRGTERYTGAESETPLTRSSLTALTNNAARRNNQ
jgi:short-subunit dehydrogenase